MEMNSHQNVAASQLVANSPARVAALRAHGAVRKPWASSASDRICSHHRGCPWPGQAMDKAWATPATAATAQAIALPGPRTRSDCGSGMFS
ncbi:hypothetical protein D3C80_1984170 [compost metagenome]